MTLGNITVLDFGVVLNERVWQRMLLRSHSKDVMS